MKKNWYWNGIAVQTESLITVSFLKPLNSRLKITTNPNFVSFLGIGLGFLLPNLIGVSFCFLIIFVLPEYLFEKQFMTRNMLV